VFGLYVMSYYDVYTFLDFCRERKGSKVYMNLYHNYNITVYIYRVIHKEGKYSKYKCIHTYVMTAWFLERILF